MVKEDEISKEFNSLNRKTADKIEKFIKDKIATFMEYEANQKNLEQGLREYEKELKIYNSKFVDTLNSYANYFDDFGDEKE
jgi:hypothetical protein